MNSRIIAVLDETANVIVMLNPEIVSREGEYVANEGCLSLPGTREATRYERITVTFQNVAMESGQQRTGWLFGGKYG